MRYRKGELLFLKSSLPKELRKYSKEHPENKEYVDQFLTEYEYNYVQKKWQKREPHNTLEKRIKGEDE